MLIKLKTTMAGPGGAYAPGIVDLPADEAKDLIAAGYAVPAPPTPEKAVMPPTELRRHPLDHNGDGQPGGSKPADERGLDELWQEGTALGIKVNKRWGAARLRDEIEKAKGAAA